jgi:hypothetical protein
MSQERWDAKLVLLHGPLKSRGEMILHGPAIRIGANPGPGGLSLKDYRGLDERQAVITTYGGEPKIEPVGSSQVRVAPHEHVDWERTQPLQDAAFLTNGCAVHLGRPGRGATFRFIDCQPLGVWEQARIQVVEDAELPEEVASQRILRADRGVPKWFVGGLVFVGLAVIVGVMLPLLQSQMRRATVPQPAEWLEDPSQQVAAISIGFVADFEGLEGVDEAWAAFVAYPNVKAQDSGVSAKDESKWDKRLLDFTSAYMVKQTKYWNFWKRLDEISKDYGGVVEALRTAGLPDALAGIPYQESKYFKSGFRRSIACAGGWWHFLPEVAHRVGIPVRNCKLEGLGETFTPTAKTAPLGLYKNAKYINRTAYKKFQDCLVDPTCTSKTRSGVASQICRIRTCEQDGRNDFEASTKGAMKLLDATWSAPEVKGSGAAVQFTIAAHNMGWDDSQFDNRRGPTNLKGRLARWKRNGGNESMAFRFVGDQMQCEANDQYKDGACKTFMPPETQHYVYRILAQHFLAVCFYAKNYPEISAFKQWSRFEDGYCSQIKIPSTAEVRDAIRKKGQ